MHIVVEKLQVELAPDQAEQRAGTFDLGTKQRRGHGFVPDEVDRADTGQWPLHDSDHGSLFAGLCAAHDARFGERKAVAVVELLQPPGSFVQKGPVNRSGQIEPRFLLQAVVVKDDVSDDFHVGQLVPFQHPKDDDQPVRFTLQLHPHVLEPFRAHQRALILTQLCQIERCTGPRADLGKHLRRRYVPISHDPHLGDHVALLV